MRRIRPTRMLVLLIAAAAAARAGAPDSLVLTLDRSVALALEQNPQIRIAEKELSKAKAGVGEAVTSLLPQVNGSANFQHAWDIQKTTVPNFIKMAMRLPDGSYVLPGVDQMPDYLQISFGIDNTFLYGATLTQPLFLGGAGWGGIRIANGAKRAAEGNLEARRQGVVYQTAAAFYSCLLAQAVADVEEQAVAQSQGNLELVRKKFEAGTASGFDKMRAEVDLANLQPLLITARNGVKSALTALRAVTGLPENAPLRVEGRLAHVEDGLDSLSLADVRTLAAKNRPELRAIEGQQALASGALSVARSAFLPKLFFQTDYSFMAMRTDYEFRQDDFSKGFTSALSLQIPLFNSGSRWFGMHKATMDARIVKDARKQLTDGIAAETEMAFNNFHEASQKYRAARESIGMAEEALRLATLMYEEGASTQLDVMGARLALTQSRLNFASSLFEYQMARYGLRRTAGILKGALE